MSTQTPAHPDPAKVSAYASAVAAALDDAFPHAFFVVDWVVMGEDQVADPATEPTYLLMTCCRVKGSDAADVILTWDGDRGWRVGRDGGRRIIIDVTELWLPLVPSPAEVVKHVRPLIEDDRVPVPDREHALIGAGLEGLDAYVLAEQGDGPERSGADVLLDHIAQHHPDVKALLATQDGDADDVVAQLVAAGWRIETTERVAGKRVRILVAPAVQGGDDRG